MELLLILSYAAFAILIFKLFRIPVNAFTLLTAVLGGVAMIAALLITMNYNHPFSTQGRFYFVTTPIVPAVEGRVLEIPAKPNQPLKAGDVLFRIDSERYENAVKAKEAALEEARQIVAQLNAASQTAQKNFETATATRDAAQDVYMRSKQLIASGSISQLQFKQAEERFFGAQSAVDAAQSEANRAALEAASAIEGVNTNVARLIAELDTARYELEQTVVRAPTDGMVL